MFIGVPKEIKPEENRIAIIPGGLETLIHRGHKVIVEGGTGLGSSFSDEEYIKAGAQVSPGHEDILQLFRHKEAKAHRHKVARIRSECRTQPVQIPFCNVS